MMAPSMTHANSPFWEKKKNSKRTHLPTSSQSL